MLQNRGGVACRHALTVATLVLDDLWGPSTRVRQEGARPPSSAGGRYEQQTQSSGSDPAHRAQNTQHDCFRFPQKLLLR